MLSRCLETSLESTLAARACSLMRQAFLKSCVHHQRAALEVDSHVGVVNLRAHNVSLTLQDSGGTP